MAISRGRIYFGSAGDVQALPMIDRSGVDVSPEHYGSIARSLTGIPTKVTYGIRKTWPLSWPYTRHGSIDHRNLMRVEAVYRGTVPRRAYLLDTRALNAFPMDVANPGSETEAKYWTANTGVVSRVEGTALHADLTNLSEGYLKWEGVIDATHSVMTTKHIPYIAGSTLLYSAYVQGSGTVRLSVDYYDQSRAFISSSDAASAALTGSGVRRSHSFTPPSNAATFTVGVRGTVTGATQVLMAGLQLRYDAGETTDTQAWSSGAGASEVVVLSYTESYPDAAGRVIGATFGAV